MIQPDTPILNPIHESNTQSSTLHSNAIMLIIRRYFVHPIMHCFHGIFCMVGHTCGLLLMKHTYYQKSSKLYILCTLVTMTTYTKYPIERNALWEVHPIFSYKNIPPSIMEYRQMISMHAGIPCCYPLT